MKWFTILALALAIGLATAASPFASAAPDGLNRVAADKAFAARAETHRAPVAGYAAPGLGFECELTYDEYGLVISYPGIATRVA